MVSMRTRGLIVAATMALLAGFSPGGSASAAVAGDDICPGRAEPTSMGDSIAQAVDFPYVPATSPQRFYEGAILRPADTATYPGKRPPVVLQPGLGQDKCTLWWAAQYLAGHGFVVTVHDTPENPVLEEDPPFYAVVEWIQVAIQGDVAVVDFLKADPAASQYAEIERLGFGGYDEGALVSSVIDTDLLEDEKTELGIDAIVSFNNLRSRLTGDVSGNGLQCFGEPQGFFIPVSPALGFAEDEPCDGLPTVLDPGIKLGGWATWRSFAFPTMEIVLRGSVHEDFADGNGGEAFWKDAGHYSAAWFRRWLGPDPAQDQVLLSPTLNGRPTVDALSQTFQSAAYLPPAADTDDFTCYLGGTCLKPAPPGPDPDPDPDPDPKPYVKKPSLETGVGGPLRAVRPGSVFRLTLSIHNRGDGPALNTRVCLEGRNARPLGCRCRNLGLIPARAKMTRHYRFRVLKNTKPGRFAAGIIKIEGGGRGSFRLPIVARRR